MRTAALRAQRTTRTHRHDRPLVPDPAFPSVTPRAQLAGATRTTKFTPRQELVDLERVRTYDQQRVPFCTKRRPSHPAKDIGRAAAFPRRRHALVANQEGQPAGLPLKIIITVNDAEHLHVVSQRVAQQSADTFAGCQLLSGVPSLQRVMWPTSASSKIGAFTDP